MLDAAWTADQLKKWLMDNQPYKEINSVVLIDESTQQPVADVEWRSVKHRGKLLVNMTNYGDAGRTVSVYLNGDKLTSDVNLIDVWSINKKRLTHCKSLFLELSDAAPFITSIVN